MPKTKVKKNKNSNTKKKATSLNKNLRNKINDLNIEVQSNKDKHLRLLAEFDNYKKRKSNEIEKLIKYEGYDFFKSLLSILDDIDRTLIIKDVKENKSIYNGVKMIKDKILSLLNSKNIIEYKSVKEVFNPDLHEAIMVKKSSHKKNIIIEEYERGYKYKDKVLRHAKVVVSE